MKIPFLQKSDGIGEQTLTCENFFLLMGASELITDEIVNPHSFEIGSPA
jgi:hypothetical protein